MKKHLIIFLKGLCMGVADIIPGVSGGTIALITGVYERLVFAIKDVDFKFITHLLRGRFKESKKNFLAIDLELFIPLFSGIAISFLILARIMGFLLNVFPSSTYAFFFGLIIASSGVLYKKVEKFSILWSIVGFLFAFYITGLGTLQSVHTLPVLFFSGMLGICAMILPGISGAFILLLLGQYEYVLHIVNNINIISIITFFLGAGLGLIIFSRILSYLLKHQESLTLSFLVGLTLGALRLLYNNITGAGFSVIILIPGILGFIFIVALSKKSSD